MLQSCPACHSDNRDIARFCDQCGAPLSPEAQQLAATRAQPAASPRTGGAINWPALLSVVAIVLAILWFIRPGEDKQPSGGADSPAGMMADVQKQLETHKKALDKDPLDVTALSELYDMYAQIGQAEKVKPFVDKALERWNKLYKGKSTEEQRRMLAGIALLALQADDLPTAAEVLKVYHAEEPENLGLTATLGNIYFELKDEPEAIKWYDEYLAQANPEEQGNDYWNILVDQATMYLHQSKGDASSLNYKEALMRLERATAENPQHWPAWYNLGEAHKAAGKKDAALAAYKKSLTVAGEDKMRAWESQKEINALEGKPAPPQPEVDPHAGLDMGGSSGLPTPPEGTPNPHGEMGGGT